MIVESAFLKIPEILISHDEPDLLYEANITNLFTNGVMLELNARNIDNPMRKIHMEKRYNPDINARCDIFLDFSSFMDTDIFNEYYIRPKAWIEAKYFGSINRNKGHETKSENAGSIIFDIFRLIKLTHDQENKLDAKYSLNIFNDESSKYLAYSRQDRTIRSWIKAITSYGISKLHFDLKDEPRSIRQIFTGVESLVIDARIKNTVFEPLCVSSSGIRFHGYLSQIISYDMIIDGVHYSSL